MGPIFFVLFFAFSSSLGAKEVITWATPDFAPVFMPDQSGYIDRYQREVQKQMPEYEHRSVKANFARALEMMRTGEKVCSLAMLKTPEREKILTYTSPYLLLHSNHLILEATDVPQNKQFISNGEIDLENFLKSGRKIGLSFGRSYGAKTDQVLASFKDSKQLDIRRGNDVFEGLFGMLDRGRLDAILGFRAELIWFSRKHKHEERLVSFPLKGEDKFFLGHAACGKSDWGVTTAKKIDAILDKMKLDKRYFSIYLEFIPGVDSTSYEREVYKRLKDN